MPEDTPNTNMDHRRPKNLEKNDGAMPRRPWECLKCGEAVASKGGHDGICDGAEYRIRETPEP